MLGSMWPLDLAVMAVAIFALGWAMPLADADLPQHLAQGEWITRHRSWPAIEPFAWTRMGEPYYAYSHLPQVLYYSLLKWFGLGGLRLLNGAVLVGAGASLLVLGRYAGWRPQVSLTLGAYNVLIAMLAVPSLRPQSFLLIAVPLGWAFAYAVLRFDRPIGGMVGLLLASALAANSHLFFPITAAPLILCLIRWPRQSWRVAAIAGPILLGWLLSPYGTRWHAVFALNFAPNAVLEHPSFIRELMSGFAQPSIVLLFVLPMLVLPWLVPRTISLRERILWAGVWLVGLMAFGLAIRLVLVWWLLCIPVAGLACMHLLRHVPSVPPRTAIRLAAYGLLLLYAVAGYRLGPDLALGQEADVHSRRLPSPVRDSVDPLVQWLECHVEPRLGGRVFTWFNYGSYLSWRMPAYSMSIDGRGIFPDSVARAEVLISAKRRPATIGPWASADVAIVPANFRVASVLDTASGWHRIAENVATSERTAIGLWVKGSWWSEVGRIPLPDAPVLIRPTKRERARIEECDGPDSQAQEITHSS